MQADDPTQHLKTMQHHQPMAPNKLLAAAEETACCYPIVGAANLKSALTENPINGEPSGFTHSNSPPECLWPTKGVMPARGSALLLCHVKTITCCPC